MKKIIGIFSSRDFSLMPFLAMAIIIIADPEIQAGRFDFKLSLKSVYDDNVLNYSDADLDRMDDTTTSADRYGLKTKDDYILTPELACVYKTRIAGHSTHFGIIGAYNFFKENDLKRYFKLESFIRRYFKKGIYIQTALSYFPDYYYRNSYSDTAGFQEAKFDKIELEFKLALDIVKALKGNVYYAYARKDFISLFDERDITSHDLKFEAIYRPAKIWKGWAAYAFSTAKSAGADNPDYRRDTSYDSFDITLGSRFYLTGIGNNGFQLAGWISYEKIFFQTEKVTLEDSYRLGRDDDRLAFSLAAKHEINRELDLNIVFNRVQKKVDLPAAGLKKYLEYSSNSFYLIFEYSF